MKSRALLLMCVCYMIWGGGMVAMKFALQSFTAIQIVAARVAVPAVIYLVLGGKWASTRVAPADWKYLVMLIACEPCLFFFCVGNAMRFTSASEGGVIAACLPIVTALGAWIFLGEKLPRLAVAGMIFAMAGVGGMSYFSVNGGAAPNPLLGNGLMLTGIIFSGGYTICARRMAPRYSGLFISAIQALGGSLVFVPLALCQDWPDKIGLPSLVGLAYLAVFIGTGVYFAFNWSLRWVPASLAGLLGNITPICTLGLAFLALHEKIAPLQVPCVLLAILGTSIAALGFRAGNNGSQDDASGNKSCHT